MSTTLLCDAKFRQGFKEFFSCCPCINVSPPGFTRREAVTSRYNSCSGSPEGHYRIIRNGNYDLHNTRTMCIPLESSELASRNDSHKIHGRLGHHHTFRRWYSQEQQNRSRKS
ncbi:hypothetical protein PGB90_003571 [Kerria lacca]